MLEGPIGAAAFNNEFGRPCLAGFFRTYLMKIQTGKGVELRGYHKPIMLAGGVGTVRRQQCLKTPNAAAPGDLVIVLGGPAMLIGLGGGAASSSAENNVDLDFASVQRGNPEVQRRAQSVINACTALGQSNPIRFIHDVGAGGLSNALTELPHDLGLGAIYELREIENADRSMSPLQIWCCEAQERYVLAIAQDGINYFKTIAERERSSYSVVGKLQEKKQLLLTDRESSLYPQPIDLPMSMLFGKPPKMSRTDETRRLNLPVFDCGVIACLSDLTTSQIVEEAARRVLQLPSVGSKSFLITIGDR